MNLSDWHWLFWRNGMGWSRLAMSQWMQARGIPRRKARAIARIMEGWMRLSGYQPVLKPATECWATGRIDGRD